MIIIPNGLSTQEIRVLQEYRRLKAETLSAEQIKGIKHPAGGGDGLALALVAKGWLAADGDGFTTTAKARELLALEPVPEFEGSAETETVAAAE